MYNQQTHLSKVWVSKYAKSSDYLLGKSQLHKHEIFCILEGLWTSCIAHPASSP